MAFNKIKKEIEKSKLTPNECIKTAVEKSWKGFESQWIDNLSFSNSQNQQKTKPSFGTNRN
ncbi:hypothetical protein Phi46:3_gp007 [Cellulophaga phage phi46:3]|uniref:Uncharacterized protein n=1 Tax=Cellulophaga phage phi46:3 TaxID=1327985 RepID=S0A058_9CAUD|nr:hypothetical protein Phi46:3_gp007 [Cellulophaga phage phi46:3]AGO48751.1 hypothetical protein Phi46:3_gp007 [Cellulophaga phage phi46:3]